MTTPEVLGIFVGIPLAICGVITAAVYASERIFAGRRKPDATPSPPTEPRRQAKAEGLPSTEGQHKPTATDREEKM